MLIFVDSKKYTLLNPRVGSQSKMQRCSQALELRALFFGPATLRINLPCVELPEGCHPSQEDS